MAGMSKIIRNYTEEDLFKAVEAVKEKAMSTREAAKCFGIPKSTITDYCKKNVTKLERIGASTVLTPAEEDVLVLWLQSCLKRGFPRQDENLLNEVQKILIEDERDNPFKDSKPGKNP